jgi:hypothetical protein
MSRFGWAYVNDVITGSGGTPGGSDKAIQFASGSTFSGSTNFTFDYTSNTVRLTGTLHADNLIVSSSTIFKSGSTKFGDDLTDTHQFTGSIFTNNNLTVIGQVSASVALNTAGTIQAASNITSTGGVISSSLGFLTSGSIQSVGNITTTGGSVSSSVALNTAGTLGVGNSATIGTGLTVLANGFRVTGSSFVTGVLSASFIQAGGFQGNGSQLTDINGSNVSGVGDDWTIQLKDGNTGTLTGSSNLTFSGSTLTLTGSFLMTGSSTFINIGPTILSGNLNVTGAITGSTAQFTEITASNITVISGTINSRGIPNVLPTSIRRTIQVFPGAGSMVNSMNPINNANDTPFTQAGTATQGFINGSAIIFYSVVSSTSTYGITTPDVGSTKVLCTSQRGPSWRGTFRTGNDITQTRIFTGFEEYAGDKSSDDPTNGYAHLSYSSVRGDTTFKIITRTANGVGTQAILDTGISASVSTNYYFDMTLTSGSYNVTLISGSSTFVGSITSSLPNITASLGTCCAAKNTAGVSRNLSIYFLEFNDS